MIKYCVRVCKETSDRCKIQRRHSFPASTISSYYHGTVVASATSTCRPAGNRILIRFRFLSRLELTGCGRHRDNLPYIPTYFSTHDQTTCSVGRGSRVNPTSFFEPDLFDYGANFQKSNCSGDHVCSSSGGSSICCQDYCYSVVSCRRATNVDPDFTIILRAPRGPAGVRGHVEIVYTTDFTVVSFLHPTEPTQ